MLCVVNNDNNKADRFITCLHIKKNLVALHINITMSARGYFFVGEMVGKKRIDAEKKINHWHSGSVNIKSNASFKPAMELFY